MTTRRWASGWPRNTPPRTWHNHSREDVVSFFAGLELVGPGVTEAQTWRAWMPEPVMRHRDGHVLAGVARIRA